MKSTRFLICITIAALLVGCSVERDVAKLFARDENPKLNQPAKASEFHKLGKKAIDPLKRALVSDSPRRRELAVGALALFKDPSLVPALAPLLKDPQAPVRRVLALALGEIGGDPAIRYLVQQLKDPDPAVRSGAVWSLGKLNATSATNAVITAFKRGPKVVYDMSVWSLSRLCKASIPPALIAALDHDRPGVRYSTIKILDLLRDRTSLRKVETMILDDTEEDEVKRVGLIHLGRNGDVISLRVFGRMLQATDDDLRMTVYYGLGLQHAGFARAALLMQGLREEDEWRRDVVARQLLGLTARSFGPDQKKYAAWLVAKTETLRQNLKSDDALTRLDAILTLSILGDRSALAPALGLMKSAKQPTFLFLSDALLRLKGNKGVVSALVDVLRKSNRNNQRALLDAAAASGAPDTLEALFIAGLESTDPETVKTALSHIKSAKLASDKVVLSALKALDKSPQLTRTVVSTLLYAARKRSAAVLSLLDRQLKTATKDRWELLITLIAQLDHNSRLAETVLLREFNAGTARRRIAILSASASFAHKRKLGLAALQHLESENQPLSDAVLRFLKAATGKSFAKDALDDWKNALKK